MGRLFGLKKKVTTVNDDMSRLMWWRYMMYFFKNEHSHIGPPIGGKRHTKPSYGGVFFERGAVVVGVE